MSLIVQKTLSSNDVGITGSHQAGMLVPKQSQLLEFFPALNKDLENPRSHVFVKDEYGTEWTFNYIYYNNALRGGTRNEYRLTGMTKYFKSVGAQPGDVLRFIKIDDNYEVVLVKDENRFLEKDGVVEIELTSSWKVFSF